MAQLASPLTTTSDALLVASARNGEHLAYVELCRRHRELVFRTVLRITRNRDDAEDVLQDSWMRALTHIGTFEERSAFSTWITRIAVNSALTMIRKKRIRKELSLDDPVDPNGRKLAEMLELSQNPEERCLEIERLRLVRQAITRLPSKLRSAVEMRQSQDGPVRDLAMLAGVSLPTMKARLMRARLRLREPLSQILKGRPTPEVSQRTNRADYLDAKVGSRRLQLHAIIPLRKAALFISTKPASVPATAETVSGSSANGSHVDRSMTQGGSDEPPIAD